MCKASNQANQKVFLSWPPLQHAAKSKQTLNSGEKHMTITELESKLVHAVTAWDKKQMTKRGYNIYALPQYLLRCDEAIADIRRGAGRDADIRCALIANFCDRLLDVVLKAADLPKSTKHEQ
jgi:hypothetical protein